MTATRTRPTTIHAQRARVLADLHDLAATLQARIGAELVPLYEPDELASTDIDRLGRVVVASLLNCLDVERVLQDGLATARMGGR